MNAYVIQEFNQLDGQWHNAMLSSSVNGIYVDENKARAVYKLFQDTSTNREHLRLVTCKLTIVAAECGDHAVDFRRELALQEA